MTRLLRRERPSSDETGVALLLVVGSMIVLAMLAMTALAYTVSSQKFARYDQDYSSTMSAAQSGIDDFIARLNRDDGYFSDVDCSNVALRGPSVAGQHLRLASDHRGRMGAGQAGATGPEGRLLPLLVRRDPGADRGHDHGPVDRQGQRRVPDGRGRRRQGWVDGLRLLHRLRVGRPVERAVLHRDEDLLADHVAEGCLRSAGTTPPCTGGKGARARTATRSSSPTMTCSRARCSRTTPCSRTIRRSPTASLGQPGVPTVTSTATDVAASACARPGRATPRELQLRPAEYSNALSLETRRRRSPTTRAATTSGPPGSSSTPPGR